MAKGPKDEHRPADVNTRAVMIARIATGEIDDTPKDDGKDPAAKALGKKGGAARAKSLTPERRAEIAKKASPTQGAPAGTAPKEAKSTPRAASGSLIIRLRPNRWKALRQ
jgi:hypothetical protein